MSIGEQPTVSQVSPGSTRECESLLDGVGLALCGLTQLYNHCMHAHSGGAQAHMGILAGDGGRQSKVVMPTSRKEAWRCPGPPSTSLCVPTVDGGVLYGTQFSERFCQSYMVLAALREDILSLKEQESPTTACWSTVCPL